MANRLFTATKRNVRPSLSAAPAKTPPEIVARLAREIDKAVKTPEVRERLNKSGVEVVGYGPEQTASFIKTEFEKYAKLLKESGAQVE